MCSLHQRLDGATHAHYAPDPTTPARCTGCPDGTVAHLRPLRRGETHLVQDVFDQLSDDSRFLRFHVADSRG